MLDFKGEREEDRHPSDVSDIISSCPRDPLRKSMNPRIGFDHQPSTGDFCMPLGPWPLKEPWLNVYRGKVPGGLHPIAAPQPSSLISQTPTLLTLTAVPPSPCLTPLTRCMIPQSKQSWAQPQLPCPIEELMPALTLIRQWSLAWKEILVCVCVCWWWASLFKRRSAKLRERMERKEWCVSRVCAYFMPLMSLMLDWGFRSDA